MAVTSDILRTWRNPRAVMRDLLARGPREDRALAFLMAACLVIFIAQWPRLARQAFEQGTAFDQLIAYEFVAWLIVWPLGFYLLALGVFGLSRVLRLGFSAYGVRLALFWSMLAAAPMALLSGMVRGFIGPGAAETATGALWLGALALFILLTLTELRRTSRAPAGG